MKSKPALFDELQTLLPTIGGRVRGLLCNSGPSETQIDEILGQFEGLIQVWAGRQSGKADALDRICDAVIDLVLWSLFNESTEQEARREIIGALWTRSEKTLLPGARAMVENLGNRDREKDRLKELMQQGFLKFESKLSKFDPNNSRHASLRTFLGTVYRREFINISKSKLMVGLQEDSIPEAADFSGDEIDAEEVTTERREKVEKTLARIAFDSERDSEKEEAFKLVLHQGMTLSLIHI